VVCLECVLPPKWHPVGPFPRSRSEPKWTLPPNFLPTLCYHERCCNWVGIKQSLEGKWRNVRRGCVPLAHSRRSLTQAKFLPQRHTVATPFSTSRLRMDLFTYHATPPGRIYWSATTLSSAQANLTKIDQALASWGKKGLDLAVRLRQLPKRGARQGDALPAQSDLTDSFLTLTLCLQRLGRHPRTNIS